jgi:hypothetical protein
MHPEDVLFLPVLIGFGRESHGLTLRLGIQIFADGHEEWSFDIEMRWLGAFHPNSGWSFESLRQGFSL